MAWLQNNLIQLKLSLFLSNSHETSDHHVVNLNSWFYPLEQANLCKWQNWLGLQKAFEHLLPILWDSSWRHQVLSFNTTIPLYHKLMFLHNIVPQDNLNIVIHTFSIFSWHHWTQSLQYSFWTVILTWNQIDALSLSLNLLLY